jgi:hypothetical protein
MADVKYVVFPNKGSQALTTGSEAAWYGLYTTGCRLQIGDIDNGPGNAEDIDHQIRSMLHQWCPRTCQEYTANIAITSAPTEFGAAAAALVAQHPSIQFIYTTLPGYAQYIVQALKTAGVLGKVKVEMPGDTPWDTQNIQIKTSGYAAEMASVSNAILGWQIMDGTLRTLGGGHGASPIVEELVINSSRYASDPFPSYDDNKYQATYLTAWAARH